jgi:ABC-type enterochelin transport system permease subunit
VIESCELRLLSHSAEVVLAAERVKSPSFRLRIPASVAALSIARHGDSLAQNGIVIFYVDENLRILGSFARTATSRRLGMVPVCTMSREEIKRIRGIVRCRLVGSFVKLVVIERQRTLSSVRFDALDVDQPS